jgi:hypothetical protein
MAVDSTALYVASYEIGPVFKVPLDGSATSVLDGVSATTVAIDGTRVYTVSPSGGNAPQGLVVACAKTGCGGNYTTLASGQDGVWGIAVDDTNVYWASQSPGNSVMKLPLAGGTPTALATGISATNIVVAAGTVFFAGVGSSADGSATLMSVPVDGGATSVVFTPASGNSVSALTTDGQNVYYGTTDGVVGRVPAGGGTATTLGTLSSGGNVGSLAVDCTSLYVVSLGDGSILSVPLSGGPMTTLATASGFSGIAVDANYVYWTSPAGTVLKLAK